MGENVRRGVGDVPRVEVLYRGHVLGSAGGCPRTAIFMVVDGERQLGIEHVWRNQRKDEK